MDGPICEGCAEELFHFCHFEKRPDDPLIEKVERHTGQSWHECKLSLLRGILEQWQTIEDDPQDWLASAKRQGWSEEEARAYAQKQLQWHSDLLSSAEAEAQTNER